jgi:hypothetical protein
MSGWQSSPEPEAAQRAIIRPALHFPYPHQRFTSGDYAEGASVRRLRFLARIKLKVPPLPNVAEYRLSDQKLMHVKLSAAGILNADAPYKLPH